MVVTSADAVVLDPDALVDWPYGPLAAGDDVLADVDGVLAGCDAALELLLLLPQPAMTVANAINASEASPGLCMGTSQHSGRLLSRPPRRAILPALRARC